MTVDVVASAILLAATCVVLAIDVAVHRRRPDERISQREMDRLRERWDQLDADGQIRPES